jgi:hypothetical protein
MQIVCPSRAPIQYTYIVPLVVQVMGKSYWKINQLVLQKKKKEKTPDAPHIYS